MILIIYSYYQPFYLQCSIIYLTHIVMRINVELLLKSDRYRGLLHYHEREISYSRYIHPADLLLCESRMTHSGRTLRYINRHNYRSRYGLLAGRQNRISSVYIPLISTIIREIKAAISAGLTSVFHTSFPGKYPFLPFRAGSVQWV